MQLAAEKMEWSPSLLKAEITYLFVMILNGTLIRKICGFANTKVITSLFRERSIFSEIQIDKWHIS